MQILTVFTDNDAPLKWNNGVSIHFFLRENHNNEEFDHLYADAIILNISYWLMINTKEELRQ
jgi:hypothetical protein